MTDDKNTLVVLGRRFTWNARYQRWECRLKGLRRQGGPLLILMQRVTLGPHPETFWVATAYDKSKDGVTAEEAVTKLQNYWLQIAALEPLG